MNIAELNRRQRIFWDVQKAFADKRFANPNLLALALERIEREDKRFIPIYNQLTLEAALEEEEAAGARHLARLGGQAEKTDALQELIEKIVEIEADISAKGLLQRLIAVSQAKTECVSDVIQEQVIFRKSGGKLGTAPISGLKDRLSRAKKKIRASS